jgi:hypothetical protein
VLDVKLPFDEKQLLLDNSSYIIRSLGLEGIRVYNSGESEAAAAAEAAKVDLAAALPGAPVYAFTTSPVTA